MVELLVVAAIIALLAAMMLPSLRGARVQGRAAVCGSNLRQLGVALHMYAADHQGLAMPLAYFDRFPATYWWGSDTSDGVHYESGIVAAYLAADLREGGVFDCPEQPVGTYALQGVSGDVTSTYGYNGYYLTPSQTPGWHTTISGRRWRSIDQTRDSSRVFAFADTLIETGGQGRNNALLDPPWLFQGHGRGWSRNEYPTTAFRHSDRTQAARLDGSVGAYRARAEWLTSEALRIGSVGETNDPHYVPDWRDW